MWTYNHHEAAMYYGKGYAGNTAYTTGGRVIKVNCEASPIGRFE